MPFEQREAVAIVERMEAEGLTLDDLDEEEREIVKNAVRFRETVFLTHSGDNMAYGDIRGPRIHLNPETLQFSG